MTRPEAGTGAAATVYVQCVDAVLQAASALGLSRRQLLLGTQIDPGRLRVAGERIPFADYLALYQLAEERSGVTDFGLYVGHISYLMGMNLHLYMTTICRDLREYLNVIPSTIRLRGDVGQVLIRPEGEYLRLEWHPLDVASARWRCLSDEMLSSSAAIVGSICALPVPVLGAHFSYPEPADRRSLELRFGRELRFDQEVSCIYFARESVRFPLVSLGYELGDEFKAGPEAFFKGGQAPDPFLRDAGEVMRRSLPGGRLTIDSLAYDLGVSRRTLQRRLGERSSSFKALLQALRFVGLQREFESIQSRSPIWSPYFRRVSKGPK